MKITEIIRGAATIMVFIVVSVFMIIGDMSEKWAFRRREKRMELLQKMKR